MNDDSSEVQNELEEAKKQAEEYLNNWKRERADFVNYKKEEAKRVEEIVKFANEGLLLKIIDVLDKLDLGLQHEPSETLKQLAKDFEKFLEWYDVKKIEAADLAGQAKFDPILHEAVEVDQDGKDLKEVRAGYIMHGKVIRPIRVKIIK